MKKKLLSVIMFSTIAGLSIQAQVTKQNSLDLWNNENKQNQLSPDRSLNFKPGKQIGSKWDTIATVWNYNDSIRYTYNSEGNVILKLTYLSDPIHPNKTNYIYNGNGKEITDTTLSWNGTSYGNYELNIYTYDVNDNQIEKLVYSSWNGSYWGAGNKSENAYDVNNNQIQDLSYYWNGSVWINSNKHYFTYDMNNNQTEDLAQSWNGSAWTNGYKNNFTWSSGQMTTWITQTWDGAAWENAWKFDYTYASGQVNGIIQFSWDGINWKNYRNTINMVWYQWNGSVSNSKPASNLKQVPNGNLWKDTTIRNWTYDAFGNQTDCLFQVKPSNTYITADAQKNIFQYDGNNNITEDIYQNWNPTAQNTRNYTKKEYSDFFQYTITGVDETNEDGLFTLFPNPSKGLFYLQSKHKLLSIVIYNLVGETIYQAEINNAYSQAEIDFNTQPNGIYFLNIKTEKGTLSKKLIINK